MDGSFSYLLINEENIVETSLPFNFDTNTSQVRITFFKVSLSADDRPSNIESMNSSRVFESLVHSSCSLLRIIDPRKKSGRFDKIRMISSVGYFCDSSDISDNFRTSLIKYKHANGKCYVNGLIVHLISWNMA
jgi:hypothetical protein